MKKHEKEIERVLLGHEKEVLKELAKTYERALSDIQKHTKQLHEQINRLVEADVENKTLIQSKIYQLNYQKALQKQISGYLDVLKSEHVKSVEDYMKVMYEDSYLTNIYNLQKYGIPVTVPINQELMIKSLTYDINKIPLSKRLYDNVDDVKKKVVSEISRGISTGMSYQDIARNIKFAIDVSNRKANMIAQNEGQRVKTDARIDSMRAAKKKGADIVKVWDATLDNKTRPVHQELDQKRAEIEEKFKFSGGEVFAPKQFGIPSLDINCRCVLISVPRWDLEDTIQKRDNINGELIEAKNYADWKKKYYNKVEKSTNDTFDIKAGNKKLKDAMSEEDYEAFTKMLNKNSDIKRLYANYADKIDGITFKKGGGVYKPSSNTLEFGYEHGIRFEEINKFSTLAHEYGHFFDAKVNFKVNYKEIDALNNHLGKGMFNRKPSSSDEFLNALREDKKLIKSLWSKEFKTELLSHHASHGVQDVITGMFKGSGMNWYHEEKYWNRKYNELNLKIGGMQLYDLRKDVQKVYKELGFDVSNQQKVASLVRNYETASEAWANVMSAIICEGEELEYVKKYLPNMYKMMSELLKGVE